MDAQALVIDGGAVTLVLGDDRTCSARNPDGDGDRVAVQIDQLRVTTAGLARFGLADAEIRALVVFAAGTADTGSAGQEGADRIQVSVFCDLGGPSIRLIHLGAENARVMLAEGARRPGGGDCPKRWMRPSAASRTTERNSRCDAWHCGVPTSGHGVHAGLTAQD